MASENKYIRLVYKIMVNEPERQPNTTNWASLVRHLLLPLGFYEVTKGVENFNIFISLLKPRLTDTFI